MSNKTLLSLLELEVPMEDLKDAMETGAPSYGAIITFDMSKRCANRDSITHTFVITGEDFDSAISEFKREDRSDGLFETDFDQPVLTVQLEVGY
ncbi:hypothetical protein LMH73_010275 [Vibrio splendidus]|nr:hypothetical protein [Vibrio splendidus]MCC4883322.1 hypothetical protein [Vibrio splendidus]